jgi:GNAT superfamily N-acetyltransferase
MSHTDQCLIVCFRVNVPYQRRKLLKLLRECDNTKFAEGYGCNDFLDTAGYDVVYVAFDEKVVVGIMALRNLIDNRNRIDGLELDRLSTRGVYDKVRYGGLGTRMMNTLIAYAKRNDTEFVYISNASDAGLSLYTKLGFKYIGRTGQLVLSLNGSFPTFDRLRYILIRDTWEVYWYRRRKRPRATESVWRKNLERTTADDQRELIRYTEKDEDVPNADFVLFSRKEILQAEPYPRWMYKYPKTPFPISL